MHLTLCKAAVLLSYHSEFSQIQLETLPFGLFSHGQHMTGTISCSDCKQCLAETKTEHCCKACTIIVALAKILQCGHFFFPETGQQFFIKQRAKNGTNGFSKVTTGFGFSEMLHCIAVCVSPLVPIRHLPQ